MYPRDIRVNDPHEALVVEQALAMYREMRTICRAAPDGQVLDRAEQVALQRGREFTRQSLESVLNAEAQEVEKRGSRVEPAPAERRGSIVDATPARSSRRRAR
jgi:hypothetical protein